jgi:hypothetical protein
MAAPPVAEHSTLGLRRDRESEGGVTIFPTGQRHGGSGSDAWRCGGGEDSRAYSVRGGD